MNSNKCALIIMDGWGINPNTAVNAIAQAKTIFVDSLYNKYPNSTLKTFGENVGLPDGQMGNSEVGHINIGAGRVVYQELTRINKAIQDGDFQKESQILKAIELAKKNKVKLHFIGLVSDGGIHSHVSHLKALMDTADAYGVSSYVHAFMDGRDTDPHGGKAYLKDIQEHGTKTNSKIATVIGRYYAMDRDQRWERIKLAYDLMTQGKGQNYINPIDGIEAAYANNQTDEFIQPIVVTENDQPIGKIESGDVVICFNFRTDRPRQITRALTQEKFPEFDMQPIDIHYFTMTKYDEDFSGIEVIYEKQNLKNSIGEWLATHNKTQLRIAETEKYPHVTFFFNGGEEHPFKGESRIMVPSPKVATYDLQPEMSADEVTQKCCNFIESEEPDFVCLNFANTDMVGHTGVFEAGMKAAETVDHCVQQVVEIALAKGYTILLTADHGNADTMINEDGSPNTAHTTNLVPLFLISEKDYTGLKDGKLADLAPTILKIMGIDCPQEMTGNILI